MFMFIGKSFLLKGLCLAENMFSLQYSTEKPLRENYTLSQHLVLSNRKCTLYFPFYRKGRLITYLTFPAMNNHNFAVCTNCPLRISCGKMCARRKLQKSHESIGRIIDICTFFSARLMENMIVNVLTQAQITRHA